MENITYKLDNFEGPLDLLLHLIDKNKIDIYDIPIVTITEQYLDYVSHMEVKDLDLMSNFLVMAATLLEIKSRMLLPMEKDENGKDIDPRAGLVERLLEHKKYKDLGYQLSDYEADAPNYILKKATIPKEVANFIPEIDYDDLLKDVTLDRLNNIFIEILKRKEESVDPLRSNFGVIKKEKLPLKDVMLNVLDYSKTHKKFSFRNMLMSQATKSEVIVSFLAILELIKIGRVTVVQDMYDNDLNIEYNENIDQTKEIDFSEVEDA